MASILFLLEAIYRNEFTCNFLESKKNFLSFFLNFWNLVEIFNIWWKKMTLITDVFPKLWRQKNLVRSIPKKSSLNWSFGKQPGKRAQTLLKFAWQHHEHIYWLIWRQLTRKKSLLVTCKISRLFPNALSAADKYSLLNRDNLTQPSQMQLSRKQKTFSEFFCAFLKSNLNFEHFQKKDDSHSWGISKFTESEKQG